MRLPGSRTMSRIAMRRTCIVRQSFQKHVPVITYSACNITKHYIVAKRVNNAHCRLRRAAIFLRYRDELTGLRDVDGQMDQDLFEASRVICTFEMKRKLENEDKSQLQNAFMEVRQLPPLMHEYISNRVDVF